MTRATRILSVGSLGLAVVIGTACNTESAITSQPVGDLGFGVTLSSVPTAIASSNLPRGVDSIPSSPIASANPANDSLRLNFAGLDSIAGGVYTVWVGNDSATSFKKVTGNLTVAVFDSTLNAAGDPVFSTTRTTRAGVSSWGTGGVNVAVTLRTSRAAIAGLSNTDSIGVVLVSIEPNANTTTPSSRRFLWARRSEGTAAGVVSNRFGNYAPRLADQFVYAINGVMGNASGAPIAPRGRAEVRGRIFVIADSNYFQPPKGFYYAAYAIKFDTTGRQLNDSAVYLGRKTTPIPNRVSLYDADSIAVDPNVVLLSQHAIIAGAHRVSADTIAKLQGRTSNFWSDYGRVVVTLENKSAASPEGKKPGPGIITAAFLPPSIRGR
jgi:hypothetical protein